MNARSHARMQPMSMYYSWIIMWTTIPRYYYCLVYWAQHRVTVCGVVSREIYCGGNWITECSATTHTAECVTHTPWAWIKRRINIPTRPIYSSVEGTEHSIGQVHWLHCERCCSAPLECLWVANNAVSTVRVSFALKSIYTFYFGQTGTEKKQILNNY